MLVFNRCEVENKAVYYAIVSGVSGRRLEQLLYLPEEQVCVLRFGNAFVFTTVLPKTLGHESNISD